MVDILSRVVLTEPDSPFAFAEPDIFAGDHFAVRHDMVSPTQHGGAEGFGEADDFHSALPSALAIAARRVSSNSSSSWSDNPPPGISQAIAL